MVGIIIIIAEFACAALWTVTCEQKLQYLGMTLSISEHSQSTICSLTEWILKASGLKSGQHVSD